VAGGFGLTAANGGTAPAYGVLAYGSLYGVFGNTTGAGNGSNGVPTSFGVTGYDAGGAVGRDTNVGVFGQTTHGTAMLALANVSTVGTQAYEDQYPLGIAAEAEPDKSGGYAIAVNAYSKAIALQAYNPATGDYVQLATSADDIVTPTFTVDTKGNVTAASLTTENGGPYVRTTGSSGTSRMAYSARSAAPDLEDSGEGQLVNGRGFVKLDAALADVIDKRNAYRVFLTPEGDSNGLYVTQKTLTGFVVREARGGRSTLAFDYRIVAKPVNENATRLALAPPLRKPETALQFLHSAHPATPQQPLDPFGRRQAHIGPAAFAREREAARKIETGP
jgi:hypothetical protein